ncbi:glycine cleavage system protein R [Lolliginicoccus levis]|uniref:glycine cleavage system protein R n=1 Tax=Lolliginicoccus levis TaxID=2919542 RepID=UPI002852A577|nr:ACT domain-containing protein [Lolliginicoccus levis]
MQRNLVMTVIGDDRAGLVSALATVITAHSGNWERSQMAELAGKFAGILVVTVPAEQVDALITATRALDGLLDVSVHEGAGPAAAGEKPRHLAISVLGNDHPGIVHELSSALSSRGLSIDKVTTATREAPMAGGMLFEAHLEVRLPHDIEVSSIRSDLERIAAELLVDLEIDERHDATI